MSEDTISLKGAQALQDQIVDAIKVASRISFENGWLVGRGLHPKITAEVEGDDDLRELSTYYGDQMAGAFADGFKGGDDGGD